MIGKEPTKEANQMSMTSIEMKRKLRERFSEDHWQTHFDRDKDTFRIEWKDTEQGVTIFSSRINLKMGKP